MLPPRAEIRRHRPAAPWTYADLDRRQAEVARAVRAGGPGKLLLSELAPVVTLGIRDTAEDLLLPESELKKRGVEVLRTSRGGRATFHGPGQWVAFPVDSIERLVGDRRGVRRAVDLLFDASLEVVRLRFPKAECRGGEEAGIWAGPGDGDGKLVALGVRFQDGVLQHGIALNVFATPESFLGIRPCGLERPVAYLERTKDDEAFELWGRWLEQALFKRFPSLR